MVQITHVHILGQLWYKLTTAIYTAYTNQYALPINVRDEFTSNQFTTQYFFYQ